MGSKKKVIVAYRYYVGMHFVLCHGPVDALTDVIVDDKAAWSGSSTGGDVYILNEDLFGGQSREGGVSGLISVMMGGSSQGQNAYLASKTGANTPSYRGVLSVVLNQVYIGLNPYLKAWKFRARRILTSSRGSAQWYSSKATINTYDMNPAHIIRECLMDPDWGMGYTSADIDDSYFVAAADRLYSDGMGISMLWESEQSIEEFIKNVMRHIEAVLYVDRTTGKFVLKLVRDGYDINSLPVFDESNILEVTEFNAPTFGEIVNSVTVNYWDRVSGNKSSVTVQDIALVQSQGSVIAATMEYDGFTNGNLAVLAASRDLRSLSAGAVNCTIKVNRAASALNVGDVIKVSWADYGISNLVCRIAEMGFGDDKDGAITLSLLQDVFSLKAATYAAPAPTMWIDPISVPEPCTNRLLVEATYLDLARNLGQTNVDSALATSNDIGYFVAAAPTPTPDAFNARINTDSGAGYAASYSVEFCPSAILSSSIAKTTTTLNVSGAQDFDQLTLGTHFQIDNELLELVSYTSTVVTARRGVLDTVPAEHSAGARLYFWEDYNGSNDVEYASGETIQVKLQTVTGKGVLALGSTPSSALTFNRRAFRPYPPGNWTINSNHFPSLVQDVPLSTSWSHRSRTQQTGDALVDFTEGSVGPEAGTTYELRVYNDTTSALVHTASGLTGTSYSSFPSWSGNYMFRLELWSKRDGYDSLYKQTHVFNYINVTYVNAENLDRFVTEDFAFQITTE